MTNEQMAALRIGAHVALNSGGPPLTVTGWEATSNTIAQENAKPTRNMPGTLLEYEADDVAVSVVWIDGKGRPQQLTAFASCFRFQGAPKMRGEHTAGNFQPTA